MSDKLEQELKACVEALNKKKKQLEELEQKIQKIQDVMQKRNYQ